MEALATKRCRVCGLVKPLDDMKRQSRNADGRTTICHKCHSAESMSYRQTPQARARYAANQRNWRVNNRDQAHARDRRKHLRTFYRMTEEEYAVKLAEQGGGCAICGTKDPGGTGGFHVDHDHACCDRKRSCGVCVRGLLCRSCNTSIAQMKEDPERLRSAAQYLETWNRDRNG